MLVTIYGLSHDLHRCYGCEKAKKWCKERNINYIFKSIIKKSNNSLGFEYRRDVIEEMKRLAGKNGAPNHFPQIFVTMNDETTWVKSIVGLRNFLLSRGIEVDDD
ncbi:hypothetical protein VmeM32_00132 [Vibrio phage vB_VmeM-32]|nr:hypothetical protein VmeM32_00132 [Vibrio phage vB_VmeM-32]